MDSEILAEKSIIRQKFKNHRQGISEERRREASQNLFAFMKERTKFAKYVLSFFCFKDEIDTEKMNFDFYLQGKLVLPKVNEDQLIPCVVEDVDSWIPNSWGILEPEKGRILTLDEIDIILVPGLAFDANNHRIGYGKGYYDKLLQHYKGTSIGIGFLEQFSPTNLPVTLLDIPLTAVHLF